MVQPADILAPAIGGCLNCGQLFLVTPGTSNCILCGRPPDLTLPFAAARPEPVEEPEEEAVVLEEPAVPPQDEEAEEGSDLINAIAEYLEGGEPTPEWVLAALLELGADPEAAATAVGRLVAVRELIAQLAQPQEPAPVAPQGEEDRTTVPSP